MFIVSEFNDYSKKNLKNLKHIVIMSLVLRGKHQILLDVLLQKHMSPLCLVKVKNSIFWVVDCVGLLENEDLYALLSRCFLVARVKQKWRSSFISCSRLHELPRKYNCIFDIQLLMHEWTYLGLRCALRKYLQPQAI